MPGRHQTLDQTAPDPSRLSPGSSPASRSARRRPAASPRDSPAPPPPRRPRPGSSTPGFSGSGAPRVEAPSASAIRTAYFCYIVERLLGDWPGRGRSASSVLGSPQSLGASSRFTSLYLPP
ncbi:hypothetical protein MTO96_029584 [Rhipicephalus appendiculatus]